MATRKKKLPELELPHVIIQAVTEYLGPRVINKLDKRQREVLAEATQDCANTVGQILAGGYTKDMPDTPVDALQRRLQAGQKA